MKEVEESPLVKRITAGDLERVMGVVGDFTITFSSDKSKLSTIYRACSIIAALDGEMLNQGAEFGHDGKRVVCHTEMEEYMWIHGVPDPGVKNPMILGDFNQLQQCLLNLIFNAVDAMPEGGVLTISSSLQGRTLEVRVHDTGCGIPKEVLPCIFDPFFTTKGEGKGLGLGLSIVRGIVMSHKGVIRVESVPGKGTVFTICLPSS